MGEATPFPKFFWSPHHMIRQSEKFCVVTQVGREGACVKRSATPSHLCINASRSLSARVEFVVKNAALLAESFHTHDTRPLNPRQHHGNAVHIDAMQTTGGKFKSDASI